MDQPKGLLSRAIAFVKHAIDIYGKNNMSVFAGYSTLFIVTALFPFIMLILSIINLLPGYSVDDVISVLFQILPDLEPIEELIESVITNLKDQSSGLLASIAAVTTLWSASKGVSSIQKGLDQLDREKGDAADEETSSKIKGTIQGTTKGILKRLLFTLILAILIPALLVFEMLGDSIARIICNTLEKMKPDDLNAYFSYIDSLFHAGSFVVIILAVLVVVAIYALLPAKHRSLKSSLPGAVLTCVCWFAFTKLFAIFMPKFFNASLYGPLASLFLMILWLWFMVIILFAGGVLNRTIEEERRS